MLIISLKKKIFFVSELFIISGFLSVSLIKTRILSTKRKHSVKVDVFYINLNINVSQQLLCFRQFDKAKYKGKDEAVYISRICPE